MKYILCLFACASISLNAQTAPNKRVSIKLESKVDPVCHMEMPKHLKDTVHIQDKIYGVCSSHCKVELKKYPKKYIRQKTKLSQ